MQDHYVERASMIMVINVPSWFANIWSMIKPLVNEATQKKVSANSILCVHA